MTTVTRRSLLAATASGAALAGAGLPTRARAVTARAGGAILKPLPPDWFVDHGTNAEMRWESVRRQDYLTDPARLFVRNHTGSTTQSSRRGMNGRPLLPDHGAPVRLVLPGWVGIASIKWLGSLDVSRTEQLSPWNTTWYRMTGGDFPAESPPLTVNPVRSAWELPWGAALPRTRHLRLSGRSGSGLGPIARVDVSVDDGLSWWPARLHRPGRREAWTQWDFEWRDPRPGEHVLLARATDVAGRTQPAVARWNDGGYFFDAVVRHPATVL
jgi:Oxidoreductase molybdopterin binding domain/Mo-co oxidoreductase dimerisation domain